MTDMTHTESGTKKEVLLDHITIDLIKTIARYLINRGIPNRQAIAVGQEVVQKLTNEYGGEQFYFGPGRSKQRLFMESILHECLQGRGIATTQARKMAANIMEDVTFEYGRLRFYLPVNSLRIGEDNSARDKFIVATYLKTPTFATIRQLSRDYKISIRRIYDIIKTKRKPRLTITSERDANILAEYQKEPTRETIKRLADEHGLKAGYTYHIVWRMMKQNEGKQNV